MPIPIRKVYFPPAARLRTYIHGRPVKGRNEPSAVGGKLHVFQTSVLDNTYILLGIAWVLHRLHKVPLEVMAENVWKNAVDLFKLKKLE